MGKKLTLNTYVKIILINNRNAIQQKTVKSEIVKSLTFIEHFFAY